MKYRVWFDAQVTWVTSVEANSEEEAELKAVELMSSEMLAVHRYNVLMIGVEESGSGSEEK